MSFPIKSILFGALALFLIPLSTLAQINMKLPKVTAAELEETAYPGDPDAEAAILVDLGYALTNQSRVVIQHHKVRRIKIYNNDGLSYADWKVGLYKSDARMDNLVSFKAYVYNLENGKVVTKKISKKSLLKEKVNDDYSEMKLAIPNVKVGSIIELDYKIETNYLYEFTWNFQHEIPVKRSEFSAGLHNYYRFNFLLRNHLPYKQIGPNHWRFVNVPAFKDEKFITSKADVLASVSYTMISAQFPGQAEPIFSVGTWNQTKALFTERWRRYGDGKKEVQGFISKNLGGVPISKVGLQTIFSKLRSNLKWSGYHSAFQTVGFGDLLSGKAGNSVDLNRLAFEVLKAKGFKAEYYITSTLANGTAKYEIPIVEKFNHLLLRVVVDGLSYWIDLTSDQASVKLPPTKLLGAQALNLAQSQRPLWREVTTNQAFQERAATTISFDTEEGSVNVAYNLVAGGYARPRYLGRTNEELLGSMGMTLGEEYSLDSMRVKTSGNPAEPVTVYCEYVNPLEDLGGLVVLNPLLTDELITSPFKSGEKRYYPIHFPHKVDRTYNATIEIPEGYVVEGLPDGLDLSLGNSMGQFNYQIRPSENSISLMLRYKMNVVDIPPNVFPALVEYFGKIQESISQSIVLKKAG